MNEATLTAIAIGVMVLANGIVGVSLLRTAARTRRSPELLIGLGLFLMGPVSQLATAFAGTGMRPAGEVDSMLHAVSSVGSAIGMSCVFLFVWKVFRPEVRWARILATVAIATIVFSNIGASVSLWLAPPEMPSRDVLHPWGLSILGMFSLAFGWAAVESGLYYAAARRRLSLGLSQPAVTNRLLLWSIASTAAFLLGVCLVRIQLEGSQITGRLLPSVLMMCVSIVTGGSMYLAFLPPRAHFAWVERRAKAS